MNTKTHEGKATKSLVNAPEKLVQLLDTNQACACLCMGKRTLQELVAARKIDVIKIGKSVRFHADDIAAFVERNRIKTIGWKEGK